ncbi:M55 family metallopeptidase [Halalkalicoccus sp. GCM10025322]|uniref:M55 family metallopeptidase n=1 Tax=Halalkalicoccus TaxID=332246 RepID=UPI002F96613C
MFLSGDDKATLEARQFVPEIETAVTKRGTGRESADHRDREEVCAAIRDGVAVAIDRLDEIPPYSGLEPPLHARGQILRAVQRLEGRPDSGVDPEVSSDSRRSRPRLEGRDADRRADDPHHRR